MAWVKLTSKQLKTALTAQEINALNTIATPETVDAVLAEEATHTAALWRARIKRIATIDKRENYVPQSLMLYILAMYRYFAFLRLPMMNDSLLDEQRCKAYEDALKILNDDLGKYIMPDVEEGEAEAGGGIGDPSISDNDAGTKMTFLGWTRNTI